MAHATAVKLAIASDKATGRPIIPGPLYAMSKSGYFYKHYQTYVSVTQAQERTDEILRSGGRINLRFWKRVYKRSE